MQWVIVCVHLRPRLRGPQLFPRAMSWLGAARPSPTRFTSRCARSLRRARACELCRLTGVLTTTLGRLTACLTATRPGSPPAGRLPSRRGQTVRCRAPRRSRASMPRSRAASPSLGRGWTGEGEGSAPAQLPALHGTPAWSRIWTWTKRQNCGGSMRADLRLRGHVRSEARIGLTGSQCTSTCWPRMSRSSSDGTHARCSLPTAPRRFRWVLHTLASRPTCRRRRHGRRRGPGSHTRAVRAPPTRRTNSTMAICSGMAWEVRRRRLSLWPVRAKHPSSRWLGVGPQTTWIWTDGCDWLSPSPRQIARGEEHHQLGVALRAGADY